MIHIINKYTSDIVKFDKFPNFGFMSKIIKFCDLSRGRIKSKLILFVPPIFDDQFNVKIIIQINFKNISFTPLILNATKIVNL